MARTADGRWIITEPTPGHPYDNGIYRALTTQIGETRFTVDMLPAFCGPMRGQGDTVTRTCRRNDIAWSLITDLNQIERDRKSLTRMRNTWAMTNLIGAIEFLERRLAFYLATWELPECSHGDQAFTEPTHDVERTLPACTC